MRTSFILSRRFFAPVVAGTSALSLRYYHSPASCESSSYRLPPPSIVELADAKPVPAASFQPKMCEKVLYLQRTPMLALEDVAAPALKLAGARFNPCTLVHHGIHGPDLYYTSLTVQDVRTPQAPLREVTGLPSGARIGHAAWSPDGRHVAFALRTSEHGDDAAARLW
jgi:hypothetical protein